MSPQSVVPFLRLSRQVTDLSERFTLDRITKSPAVFDKVKLSWMNGQHLRGLGDEKVRQATTHLPAPHRLLPWTAEGPLLFGSLPFSFLPLTLPLIANAAGRGAGCRQGGGAGPRQARGQRLHPGSGSPLTGRPGAR